MIVAVRPQAATRVVGTGDDRAALFRCIADGLGDLASRAIMGLVDSGDASLPEAA